MKKFYLMGLMLAASLLTAQAKVGFLMTVESMEDFPAETYKGTDESPELNAAQWFDETYVQEDLGEFLSMDDLAAGIDAEEFNVLWINLDRVGLTDVAAAGFNDAMIAKVKQYVADGGNLYLTKQANYLTFAMGRMGYAPGWGNGGYHDGGDMWTINAQLGLWPPIGQVFDRRDHAVFDWVDVSSEYNAYTYEEVSYPFETMPMVGAVARTDNNNMWTDMFRKDPNTGGQMAETEGVTHYQNDNALRLTDFEEDWNCKVLAVWGHVVDFCGAGIIEFKPEGEFKGIILTNGFAAYQWGTSNDQIANVQQLTESALTYLEDPQEEETAIDETLADGEKKVVIEGIFDLSGRKISESQMVPGVTYIVDGVKTIK